MKPLLFLLTLALGPVPLRAQISPPTGAVAAPPTYFASTVQSNNGIAMAATATDFFCIQGSGTKTVLITSVVGTFQTSTAALKGSYALLLRSSANSGGSTTALTAQPNDTNNAAATASAFVYTANPAALGTLAATVASDVIGTQSTQTNIPQGPWYLLTIGWGTTRGTQPLTLRGTAQELCFNAFAGNPASTFFQVRVEWYEQ